MDDDPDLLEAIRQSLEDEEYRKTIESSRREDEQKKMSKAKAAEMGGVGDNIPIVDTALCDMPGKGRAGGVLRESEIELIEIPFTRTFNDTRHFSRINVPGDGSCFYHAVIEGLRNSAPLWKTIRHPEPTDGVPHTLCHLIVFWWAKYTKANGISDKVTDDNVNALMNFEFLRYITSESITAELFDNYQVFAGNDPELKVFDSLEDLKRAVRFERDFYADDFTISVLNSALHPFVNILTVKQERGKTYSVRRDDRGPKVHEEYKTTYSVRSDNDGAVSYLWVLNAGLHYYLLKKNGGTNDYYIDTMPILDEKILKYIRD
jgi:hypothetical protein